MVGVLLVAAGVLGAGGFAAYPWGGHSPGRVGTSVVLWLATLGLFVWSYLAARRPQPAPTTSADGPMVIARELVNNGIIARTISSPSTPVPARPNTRELLRQQIVDLRERGEQINRLPDVNRVLIQAPPWQDEVFALLDSALADPMQAQGFALLGVPLQGQPLHAGLGQRIGSQVRCLGTVLDQLDRLDLKDDWVP